MRPAWPRPASLTKGTAAATTMYPIVPDRARYPKTGRDVRLTFGEIGSGPRPPARTLAPRTFIPWQVVRFIVIDLRMMVIISKSHD